ncbi:MAG: GNAT family N-acetyltransferase [Sedimentisphaeraceae bacterium JB056]
MYKRKDHVDGNCTTVQWQKSRSKIAVIPVGSFEQHSSYLPLRTDAIEAEFFAAVVARHFDCAFLPVISIAQSLEHQGFRGSVSFRPTTMISMINDLVDELERQNFTRVILVNAHGGNYILGPVVRDINRSERAVKVMLVNFWEHDSSDEGRKLWAGEVHAGAWETSVMLAIAPELVGDYRGANNTVGLERAIQSDLNHFGVGALRPSGQWGDQQKASEQAGKAIIESISGNIVSHIETRLEWFEKIVCFSGRGGILVDNLLENELDKGLELSLGAGWNQLMADWKLIYRLNPDGTFAALHNGRIVGTAAGVNYDGKIGLIGMVLVNPNMRRRGIATDLMNSCEKALSGCRSVKLDATLEGKKVYQRIGYKTECSLTRYVGSGLISGEQGCDQKLVRPMTSADVSRIAEIDAREFGADRKTMIEGLLEMASEYSFVFEKDGGIKGFVQGRRGAKYEFIGPLWAVDEAAASGLLRCVLMQAAQKPVAIDTFDENKSWNKRLADMGFKPSRCFARMFKGENIAASKKYFASAGPELG